jgi:glycosyltransferase involved in cell wall biosynthesis
VGGIRHQIKNEWNGFLVNTPDQGAARIVQLLKDPGLRDRIGSRAKECVRHDGVTGFVVPGEAEAAEAIGRLSELDRRKVRIHFEKRFTATRMARDYLRQYEALVQPSVLRSSGRHEDRRASGLVP